MCTLHHIATQYSYMFDICTTASTTHDIRTYLASQCSISLDIKPVHTITKFYSPNTIDTYNITGTHIIIGNSEHQPQPSLCVKSLTQEDFSTQLATQLILLSIATQLGYEDISFNLSYNCEVKSFLVHVSVNGIISCFKHKELATVIIKGIRVWTDVKFINI